MIYLYIDLLISSLTSYKTSFIMIDTLDKHSFKYIILISILIGYFTNNYMYFIMFIFVYYFISYLKRYINNKYLLYLISYLLIYNININIISLITFLISVLLIYFNPYN